MRLRNGVAPVAGSYEAARDAVQEGFARALRSSGQYSGRGSLEGWVWRIVLRTALEQRRPGDEVPLDEVEATLVEPERDLTLTEVGYTTWVRTTADTIARDTWATGGP